MEEHQTELRIALPDDQIGGVWANYARVSHSPYEFTIDFSRLDFSQGDGDVVPGRVVARVNVSPLFITQLLKAIEENWSKYAERAMPPEVQDDHDEG